jgi:hypothetical protein
MPEAQHNSLKLPLQVIRKRKFAIETGILNI